MNDDKNPFVGHGAASRRPDARWLFGIAAGTLAAIVVGIFGWLAFREQAGRLERVRAELEEVRTLAARSRSEAVELREKLTGSESRVSELEKEKEAAVHTHQGLEEEMRAELESKDVTISQLQGKLTVNILDRILFDSGEAVLKSGGEGVLQKIAGILAQHPTLKIHVIGNTDNVPIRAHARSRFASNWELSTARALAAVRFLTETAGVDPRRVGAVGYGEFRPVADNATAEGRARNRRIAISILADELAGADTVPAVKTNSPANLPPMAAEPDDSARDEK
jgi:chemotaxis protein MotB